MNIYYNNDFIFEDFFALRESNSGSASFINIGNLVMNLFSHKILEAVLEDGWEKDKFKKLRDLGEWNLTYGDTADSVKVDGTPGVIPFLLTGKKKDPKKSEDEKKPANELAIKHHFLGLHTQQGTEFTMLLPIGVHAKVHTAAFAKIKAQVEPILKEGVYKKYKDAFDLVDQSRRDGSFDTLFSKFGNAEIKARLNEWLYRKSLQALQEANMLCNLYWQCLDDAVMENEDIITKLHMDNKDIVWLDDNSGIMVFVQDYKNSSDTFVTQDNTSQFDIVSPTMFYGFLRVSKDGSNIKIVDERVIRDYNTYKQLVETNKANRKKIKEAVDSSSDFVEVKLFDVLNFIDINRYSHDWDVDELKDQESLFYRKMIDHGWHVKCRKGKLASILNIVYSHRSMDLVKNDLRCVDPDGNEWWPDSCSKSIFNITSSRKLLAVVLDHSSDQPLRYFDADNKEIPIQKSIILENNFQVYSLEYEIPEDENKKVVGCIIDADKVTQSYILYRDWAIVKGDKPLTKVQYAKKVIVNSDVTVDVDRIDWTSREYLVYIEDINKLINTKYIDKKGWIIYTASSKKSAESNLKNKKCIHWEISKEEFAKQFGIPLYLDKTEISEK